MAWSKLLMSGFFALVVALGLGYAWGASGRSAAQQALADAREQLDLAEARGHLLEARDSLYKLNFGDATRGLEESKVPLGRLRERYDDDGRRDALSAVDAAIKHVDDAQRLAGKLDQAANSKTSEALDALKAVKR